jgi:hypothetical protein
MKVIIRVQQGGHWGDINITRSNLRDMMTFIAETVAALKIRAKSA